MDKLEDVGVSLEVSNNLLGSSRRQTPTSSQTPVIQLPGAQAPMRSTSQRAAAPGVSPDAFASQEPLNVAAINVDGWKFVAAAGAIIGLGALTLFYFSR